MVSLLLATFVAVQVQVTTTTSDSARQAGVTIRIGGGVDNGDHARIPVTAEHLATAFRTPAAGTLLTAARAARVRQDSALRTYDAKVFQRMSVGLSVRPTARDRLMVREEGVARVQWDRDAGAVVDMLGKRTTVPMADAEAQRGDTAGIRSNTSLPIPYFPGRETLWIGSSVTQVEVDETELVHPIAEGSEAYYTYEIGDSIIFSLPDDRRITLRELRVFPREPRWNLIVGSFWFDAATAQPVRAVYRMSVEADLWRVAAEEAARDSSTDDVPFWVRGLVSPLRASIQVITTESALFAGQFWLPTSQAAEGRLQASFLRVPVTFEERYEYATVNGPVEVAVPMSRIAPPPATFDFQALRDSLRRAGVRRGAADSIISRRMRAFNDSLPSVIRTREVRDSLRLAGVDSAGVREFMRQRATARTDSIRGEYARQCTDSTASTSRRIRRYQGTLDVLLRVPCDLESLRTSPELPPSPYDAGEELFGKRERDELRQALDFGLQALWGPQRLVVDWGVSQTRFNRVEGLSTGISVRQELGKGYTWGALLRAGQGDRQVNGELGIERGNGTTSLRLNAYRRLVAANDWGTPLSFSTSVTNLLTGRDEGFYYRAWGGELVRQTQTAGHATWRLFAEEHLNAPVTTRFSLFRGSHDDRYLANVEAARETFVGGSVRLQRGWGLNPRGWQTLADLRLEGAGGTRDYGRAALDLTVSRGVFRDIAVAVTGAGGTSAGDLPPQRGWFLGGVQTVRGQRADAGAGEAFWFSRVELARGPAASRVAVFGDVGWAGARDGDWGQSERLLSGVGVGASFLQGMLRFDLARGLWPSESWRFYSSLEARF